MKIRLLLVLFLLQPYLYATDPIMEEICSDPVFIERMNGDKVTGAGWGTQLHVKALEHFTSQPFENILYEAINDGHEKMEFVWAVKGERTFYVPKNIWNNLSKEQKKDYQEEGLYYLNLKTLGRYKPHDTTHSFNSSNYMAIPLLPPPIILPLHPIPMPLSMMPIPFTTSPQELMHATKGIPLSVFLGSFNAGSTIIIVRCQNNTFLTQDEYHALCQRTIPVSLPSSSSTTVHIDAPQNPEALSVLCTKNETIEHSDPEQNKDITQQSVTEKSHSLPAIQPQNTTSLCFMTPPLPVSENPNSLVPIEEMVCTIQSEEPIDKEQSTDNDSTVPKKNLVVSIQRKRFKTIEQKNQGEINKFLHSECYEKLFLCLAFDPNAILNELKKLAQQSRGNKVYQALCYAMLNQTLPEDLKDFIKTIDPLKISLKKDKCPQELTRAIKAFFSDNSWEILQPTNKQKKKASLTPEGSVIAAQLLIHGTSAPKDMQIGPCNEPSQKQCAHEKAHFLLQEFIKNNPDHTLTPHAAYLLFKSITHQTLYSCSTNKVPFNIEDLEKCWNHLEFTNYPHKEMVEKTLEVTRYSNHVVQNKSIDARTAAYQAQMRKQLRERGVNIPLDPQEQEEQKRKKETQARLAAATLAKKEEEAAAKKAKKKQAQKEKEQLSKEEQALLEQGAREQEESIGRAYQEYKKENNLPDVSKKQEQARFQKWKSELEIVKESLEKMSSNEQLAIEKFFQKKSNRTTSNPPCPSKKCILEPNFLEAYFNTHLIDNASLPSLLEHFYTLTHKHQFPKEQYEKTLKIILSQQNKQWKRVIEDILGASSNPPTSRLKEIEQYFSYYEKVIYQNDTIHAQTMHKNEIVDIIEKVMVNLCILSLLDGITGEDIRILFEEKVKEDSQFYNLYFTIKYNLSEHPKADHGALSHSQKYFLIDPFNINLSPEILETMFNCIKCKLCSTSNSYKLCSRNAAQCIPDIAGYYETIHSLYTEDLRKENPHIFAECYTFMIHTIDWITAYIKSELEDQETNKQKKLEFIENLNNNFNKKFPLCYSTVHAKLENSEWPDWQNWKEYFTKIIKTFTEEENKRAIATLLAETQKELSETQKELG